MKIIVKCKMVDMYGFCGREFHPTKAHVGREFEVIAMSEEASSFDGHCETSDNIIGEKSAAEYLAHREAVQEDDRCGIYKILRCTDGVSIIDFMQFEVTIVDVSKE